VDPLEHDATRDIRLTRINCQISISFLCKNLFIEASIIMQLRYKNISIHVPFRNYTIENFNKRTLLKEEKIEAINI